MRIAYLTGAPCGAPVDASLAVRAVPRLRRADEVALVVVAVDQEHELVRVLAHGHVLHVVVLPRNEAMPPVAGRVAVPDLHRDAIAHVVPDGEVVPVRVPDRPS